MTDKAETKKRIEKLEDELIHEQNMYLFRDKYTNKKWNRVFDVTVKAIQKLKDKLKALK